jgi:hypothetical protein
LSNVITGSKKLLRVEKRKNNSRFKNQLIEARQSLIYTPDERYIFDFPIGSKGTKYTLFVLWLTPTKE